MTLVEVLVTGSLFAIVLTMVARAMVVGQHAQTTLSHKVDIVRKASTALDLLVRDAEAGQFITRLTYLHTGTVTALPAAFTVVDTPDELKVRRTAAGPTIYDLPHDIDVGYWRDPADLTLHRTLYDSGPPQDKIIARDVGRFDFQVVPNATTGLSVVTVRVKVGTINDPVFAEFSLENGP